MNGRHSVFELGNAESVVSVYKNVYYSLERIKPATKTTAPPRKHRQIMPRVSVYALDCKSIAFIALNIIFNQS